MDDREPGVRARHLGRVFMHALQAKRFTSQEIAAKLGWSTARFSRGLTGKRPWPPLDVAAFLALCGITGPARDQVLTLAEQARAESPWFEEHGTCLPADLPALRELEDTATSLTCVDMVTVPALGQTEDYRRTLLRATPVIPDGELAERINAHRTRQELVLNRRNAPTLRLFLAEQVLADPGIDRGVLCDQVHHLLQLAVRLHVEIRVIPARCSVPATCPTFQLMRFSEGRPVVYLEHLTSTVFLDHPTTIASYKKVLAKIASTALNAELSRTKLAMLALDLSHPDTPETPSDDWLGRDLTVTARPEPDEDGRADAH